MSSFKLCLWEDSMFVNYLVPSKETKLKMMVTLLSPFTKLRITLCRSPEDTIQEFVERLTLKLIKDQIKAKATEKLKRNCVLILDNGIQVPRSSKCYVIFEKTKENITLQIKDHSYKIIVNAPIINDFKLGYSPYQGLMIYPYAFDQRYNVSVMDTQYLWYRINSKDETEVGNKFTYTQTAEDINCCLKLVCSPFNHVGQPGPKAEITSSIVLENTIQLYPFEKRLTTKPYNR